MKFKHPFFFETNSMPLKLKSTFFSDRHNYKNLYLLMFFAASIKKVRKFLKFKVFYLSDRFLLVLKNNKIIYLHILLYKIYTNYSTLKEILFHYVSFAMLHTSPESCYEHHHPHCFVCAISVVYCL